MNNLKIFNNDTFGKLTVLLTSDGKELFKLNDVAWSLGYTRANSKGVLYLRKDRIEKILTNLDISTCDHDGHKYIDESGLYDFIFESGTDKAREFRKWVTSEVLPSIRKHGAYMTPETIEQALLNPDTIIKLATNLKEEQQKRIAAEQKIEKQKPLVSFAETCMASNKSILVRELAKLASKQGILIGEKRLYQKLRDWKLIFKDKNEPYQEYIDRGYFEITQGVKETEKGSFTWQTMRVTPKGQIYIVNRLKKEKEHLRVVK
jgi:anti-repressor protein